MPGRVVPFPPRATGQPRAGLSLGRLVAPPRPAGALPRAAAVEGLEAGLWRKLTQVVAPPGSGKTSLLAAWLQQTRWPAGWLSVDLADRAPGRGLGHLLAAAGRAVPEVGASAEALARVPGPYVPEVVLAEALVAPLLTTGARAVLVLDDVHHLAGSPLAPALAWLVRRAPPGLHLLVSAPEAQAWLQEGLGRGEATTVGPDALALGAEEAVRLGAPPDEADAVVAACEGRILWARVALAGGWAAGARDARGWADAWRRGFGPELAAVLTAAAGATRVCAAGLAEGAEQPEMQERLRRLAERGALLPRDGHGEWYALHPELREALGGVGEAAEPTVALAGEVSPAVAAGEASLARGALEDAQVSLQDAQEALRGYEGSGWEAGVATLAAGVALAAGDDALGPADRALACLDACPDPALRPVAEARWAQAWAGAQAAPDDRPDGLSGRETAVLAGARAGETDQAIAARLGIALATVKVTLHELALRLEVEGRLGLVRGAGRP